MCDANLFTAVFTCSFDHVAKILPLFQCHFTRARNAGLEVVSVHLLKSIYLPIMLCRTKVLQLSMTMLGLVVGMLYNFFN